jgi:SAM-dependent methyltransferase
VVRVAEEPRLEGVPNPFFSRHAAAYAASARHARGADLGRLVEGVGAAPGLAAVDVATGTGHTALALAERGCRVTGVDPTPAMLAEARALAEQRGLTAAVAFVPGVAEALPLPEAAADIVTCRRAAHHFADVRLAVAEMVRVLRPGGRLGISDMCPPAGVADLVNRLERLRDATHAAALDDGAWRAAVEGAGLRVAALEVTLEDMGFEEWLAPVAPGGSEAEAIRAALGELSAPEREAVTGGPGRWRKRRLVLVAERRP